MLAAIGFTIGFVIAVGAFLAIVIRRNRTPMTEKRRAIMEFQDILNHRLKEHDPRVQVWIANDDMRYLPYAMILAHGHVFITRSSDDPEDMRAKADKAANFFAKKQLMKWIRND